MTDYAELIEELHKQGKLEEGSVAREGKEDLTEKMKSFLINSKITMKGYLTRFSRLTGNRRIYFDGDFYKFIKP